jgi:ribose transport system substrate-binding protein
MLRKSLLCALVALGVLAIAFTISACGSSSSSSSSGSSSSAEESEPATSETASEEEGSSGEEEASTESASFTTPEAADALKEITGFEPFTKEPAVAELKERIESYMSTPKEILEKTPLKKKPESGKTLDLLVCGVPVCSQFNEAASEAAELFGWKTKKVDLGVSPQDFVNAYEQAIQDEPDMVVSSGLPRELFDAQLTKLEEMGIPVIEWSSGIEPVEGKVWVTTDTPMYEASGLMMAELIAGESEMKGKVVTYSVAQYPMTEAMVHTMQEYGPKLCPECEFTLEEVPVSDIGKLGATVTGYLQQHPETEYVFCGFGDLCQGVGTALKAAGLSNVKILTRDSSTTNFQNVANGLEWAALPLPIYQTGWQIVDLAARVFNEESTEGTRFSPMQIVTSEQISDPSSKTIGSVPDYEAQYKKLWGLGG